MGTFAYFFIPIWHRLYLVLRGFYVCNIHTYSLHTGNVPLNRGQVMGPEGKSKLRLRNLSNDQLVKLYDSELVLRLHNAKNLTDTRKILAHFKEYLGNFPPSAELAKG